MMYRLRLDSVTKAGLTSALALAAGLGACAPQRAENGTDGQPAPPALSDANVASIVNSANNGEIQEAQLVLQRSSNPAVREFAQRMIADHTASNQRLQAVLSDIGVAPAPMGLTQQLDNSESQTLQSLGDRTGADLDRTYIDHQITVHQWLIESIDSMLIPSASNDKLEDYLMDLRPTIVSHLEHARRIRASLGR
jgi:putative membrane protein